MFDFENLTNDELFIGTWSIAIKRYQFANWQHQNVCHFYITIIHGKVLDYRSQISSYVHAIQIGTYTKEIL